MALVPLTAEWVDGSWPAAHSGAGTTFTRRVQFSEDVAVSYLVLRDEALEVTNGEAEKFRRVEGRVDLREIEIERDSNAAVGPGLPATADCAAAVALSGGLPAEAGAPVACSGR